MFGFTLHHLLFPTLIFVAVLFSTCGSCCRSLAQISTSSHSALTAHSVNTQEPLDPDTEIISLELKIATRKDRGSGTDNAVYFDIGPIGWKLGKPHHNDFEGGHTDTYTLKLPCGEHFTLTTDDILWLRLHKKGVLGVTGTKDGLDGAWHPERITLIVNGVDFMTAEIESSLNSTRWFWRRSRVDPYADPKSFARSLRLVKNQSLGGFSKFIGFATTQLFKKQGISGWLKCPEKREQSRQSSGDPCLRVPPIVCATGIVAGDPARSTDGLATIDLNVDVVEFCETDATTSCPKQFDLANPLSGVTRPRFLRVEYKHRGKGVPRDGKRVRICGRLRWDTDKEGWWEIHPHGADDVRPVP